MKGRNEIIVRQHESAYAFTGMHTSKSIWRILTENTNYSGGSEVSPLLTPVASNGLWYLFSVSQYLHIPFFFEFLTCKYLSSLSEPCIFDGKEYSELHLCYWNISRPVTSRGGLRREGLDQHHSLLHALTFSKGLQR